MGDALRALVPVAIATGAALISAGLARVLRGSIALRRGLQADASVVDALRGAPQEALRKDMGDRAVQLVAVSRYPLFTGAEVVAAVVALLALGAAIAFALPMIESYGGTGFGVEAMIGVLAATSFLVDPIWLFISRGWNQRTIARLAYLSTHLDRSAIDQAALTARVATTVVRLIAHVVLTGSTFGVWLATTLAMKEPSATDVALCIGALVLIVGAAGLTTIALSHSEELDAALPRLRDVMGLDALLVGAGAEQMTTPRGP